MPPALSNVCCRRCWLWGLQAHRTIFVFRSNPYFDDERLVKEYPTTEDSTKIKGELLDSLHMCRKAFAAVAAASMPLELPAQPCCGLFLILLLPPPDYPCHVPA